MKIAIITFGNLRVTPYLKNYTKILNDNSVSYEIVYWNRSGENESFDNIPLHKFELPLENGKSKIKKFSSMFRYSKFVQKCLYENEFDYCIVLTTLLGVFLSNFLVKNYKNKYIFDIRDYSYEGFKPYYKKVETVMSNSQINVISSPDFKTFLPNVESIVCHNMTFKSKDNIHTFKKAKLPLKIGFVGTIRYANECEKVIESIGNNSNFEFHFYGMGTDEERLKLFCEQNKYKNVYFNGVFSSNQKDLIYENIDVIYNCYGNESPAVKYALSNKYYDALFYKKPILVNEDTSMARYSGKLGFQVKDYDTFPSEFIEWYYSISNQEINDFCDDFLKKYIEENNGFDTFVTKSIREEG